MKRVLFIGCPGAGKTTLSKKFAAKADLPLVHLDQLFWKPGWVERSDEEFHAALDAVLAQDEWVIDGNYGSSVEKRLQRADTAVFLDFNNIFCVYRVCKRALMREGFQAEGCPQKVDWEFIHHMLFIYPKRARKIREEYMEKYPEIAWFRLKNRRAVKRFMLEFDLV